MCRQVAPQQRLVGRDVEQEGERLHVEARLQHLQTWEDTSRLGAYSAKSTERSHSITRWLVHWETSAGVMWFWTTTTTTDF
ncbi:hypothetical protein EYF80_028485 [Liparis tanakae]|uniref:Uncharacterized protein n=1 Tax=Liparis tanakae TaxID=230148 RepID=A0A4Z2H935_9TELE|nr:hypothetical protein EYF80_028485 [Liparis tanakae]